ncbi:glycoside hydrolase family 2 protein [Moniliophthora roreri MCA 2997]|uniref:Beta-mannosidase B n=2 Tax=Moniliophthora roreri TaxID=221103 RepID=V2XL44_MONRO|nr:glycoside hydrolase family 2 protein [Moniliophthora roreri MCA 2997]KAI3611033.1 glycoside hydrolase family 2 protein [Moniliophthora roreri]
MQTEIPITKWEWKQRDADNHPNVLDESSFQVASSLEIHTELIKHGIIPDPYQAFNEHKVQWVGDVQWVWRSSFSTPHTTEKHLELVFEGLDAICDVYLNGTKILSNQNQFHIHGIPIPHDLLKAKEENVLLIHFHSAKLLAKELEAKFGQVRAGSTNLGDPSRVYVRKAQYDWRWDWGPELHTCGPYRPVTLRSYNVSISDVYPRGIVTNGKEIVLKLDVTLKGNLNGAKLLKVSLAGRNGGSVIKSADVPLSLSEEGEREVKDILHWPHLEKEGVELWWPAGYGSQTLYDVKVDVVDAQGQALSTLTKHLGFRSIQLVQNDLEYPDQYGHGTTFFFRVNEVPVFLGGSNWIPADNMLTTISPDRYRAWLKLLADGGQNTVRIWGGGVYEPDVFYETCDELGLLVWHDFLFACGVYPGAQFPEFVESVRREAEDQVRRLRSHPSIALWCGNNEDYQMVHQWGDVPSLPAIVLYEDVLPSVVSKLTNPETPYWRGSPYGGKGWDTADPTVGDVHQWEIWGGKERPWHEYVKRGGRFISEFGIPSLPAMPTIHTFFDGLSPTEKEKHWFAQSKVMAQHCRAGSFERRFALLMNESYKVTEDLETYAYLTQLLQFEAVGYAYSSWRREWRGPGKEYCGGVLVWQSNDCWPVTSWAIIDYYLRPKPVYYAIKRALAPIALGIFRTVHKNRPNDRPIQFYEYGAFQSVRATLDIWAANSNLNPVAGTLEVTFFDLDDQDFRQTEIRQVILQSNQSTELITGIKVPRAPGGTIVVQAKIVGELGEVLALETNWPEPYRYLDVPDAGLTVSAKLVDADSAEVILEVQRPARCLMLSLKEDGVVPRRENLEMQWNRVAWSDNAFDLMPGEKRIVRVSRLEGLKDKEIEVRMLGKEKGRVFAKL